MEGQQVRCVVCGEEEGTPSSTDKQKKGSTLLENYVKCLDQHFQGSNLGGNEGSGNEGMVCDGCSFNLSSVVNNIERMEVVKKEVSKLEKTLHNKLRELKSTGQKVVLELEQIGECMGDRNKDSNLIQKVVYLMKVTEKASKGIRHTLRNVEEKQSFVKKWTCGEAAEAGGSADSERDVRIISVTSLATNTNDGFEESEVFQVKTEPEEDCLSNGVPSPPASETPVLKKVIKLEKEPVRETRQGKIYRTRIISKQLDLDDVVYMTADKQAAEPEVIEIEDYDNEAELLSAVPVASESTLPSHDNQASAKASAIKRGNTELKGIANGGEVGPCRKKLRRVAEMTEKVETEEDIFLRNWVSEAVSWLRNPQRVKQLAIRLESVPKLSPELFHELVVALKDANQLKLLLPDCNKKRRLHEILQRIPEVYERTLDILSEAKKIDVNILDPVKHSVLYTVIKNNRSVPLLKSLIKRGANANAREVDYSGKNLIHNGIKFKCDPELLEFLISNGADVDCQDKSGDRPLSKFRRAKNQKDIFRLFKVFVSAGADLPGTTALYEYLMSPGVERSRRHFRELFEFISSKDKVGWLNVENKNKLNETPLHLFLQMFEIDIEALEMLCKEQVDFTKVDKNGYGCLHYAIIGGNSTPECLQRLVDKGADVNGVTKNEETLLHFAVEHFAPLETFQFLLGKGLDIAAVQYSGYTALDIAIEKGMSTEMLSKLFIWTFNAGVRHSKAWQNPMPMLHLAVEHVTPDVVEHMLLAKASPNEPDQYGETPIWKAICCAETQYPVEKAKLLVKKKASIRPGNDGKTLLHHAAKSGTIKALKYCVEELRINLDSMDRYGKTPLLSIIMCETLDLNQKKKAKLLIECGAKIHDKDGKTVLHHAAMSGTVEALKYCVEELGIDIDTKDKHGRTPLLSIMFARYYYESEVEKAKILVLNGADVNAKPNPTWFVNQVMKLQTPLHLALYDDECLSPHAFELVKFLLENGANVNEPSLGGWTAIQLAKTKPGDAAMKFINLLKEFGALE